MNSVPDFYLTSSDYSGFEIPRKCVGVKRLRYEKRDDFLLVEIDPPFQGENFHQKPGPIDSLVLASRHQGFSLFSIKEWPVSVYISAVQNVDIEKVAILKEKDLLMIAWGEIYQTEEDAQKASENFTQSNLHNPKL